MADTLNRGYPYPLPNSDPDVPYWAQRLAEDVDVDVKAVYDLLNPIAAKTIPAGTQSGVVTVTVNNATAAGAATVTFPTAFSAAPNAVMLTKATVSGAASTQRRLQPVVSGVTATGFTANLETADGTNVGATFAVSCHWVAVKN